MAQTHIGRQPIINSKGKIVAYELLYRERGHDQDRAVTASVINALLNVFGMEKILGAHDGFVKIDRAFLQAEVIESLPREKLVFLLFEYTQLDERLLKRIRQLCDDGFRFGLNDFAFNEESLRGFEPLLPYLEYLKIDIRRSDMHYFSRMAQTLIARGVKLVGAKIETHEEHGMCHSLGCSAFQGYFIAKPSIIENTSISPEYEGMMQLWNLLQSDAEIEELDHAFELNHAISIKLLRFINSAAFSLRSPVSSIRHVLTLMGREPLSRWIMLLMFSEAEKSPKHNTPLLVMVINRTELMTRLMTMIRPDAGKSQIAEAYFTGMLSLIHLLFALPHREIIRRLNVRPEIEAALFEGEGQLGELLALVRSIELFDVDAIDAFLARHDVAYETLEAVMAETMQVVNEFENAIL